MANPVLARDSFLDARAAAADGTMTIRGTVQRTALLVAVTGGIALATYALSGDAPSLGLAILVSALAGLGLAFATVWRPHWAPVTAPLYAIVEGLVLGGVTRLVALTEPRGAVLAVQALGLTVAVAGTVLALYATRVVTVTDRVRGVITGMTLAIFVYYMLALVLGFFGVQLPFLHEGGWLSIGFSLVVTGVAAANLLLDFDLIERASAAGAPRHMEWYGAFGVLVTLVWLYLEILRLLRKLRR
jgi:uncharacterized YccA/Bax inhibitor family protein